LTAETVLKVCESGVCHVYMRMFVLIVRLVTQYCILKTIANQQI